jgi:hypothetical protein
MLQAAQNADVWRNEKMGGQQRIIHDETELHVKKMPTF